ncbi:hypothetical protein [Roseateles sp. BYS96W]|uniref:Aspartate transcarbamylase n=1 Tax=Pelomonas nitida TaxID=3299027 RepID=A0ABW7GD22_9BURK
MTTNSTRNNASLAAIQDKARETRSLLPPNIIDMHELSAPAIRAVFELADSLRSLPPDQAVQLQPGRVVSTLFYQPSTRTRLNFDAAAQRLGASVVGFCDPATTRAGDFYQESLEDVVRFTSELVDLVVLRHHETGAALRAASCSSVPVISAGDGYGQHPTQALGDIWTMCGILGELRNRRIGMVGDVNIRSLKAISIGLSTLNVGELVYLLPKGAVFPEVVVRTLDEKRIPFRFVEHIDEMLSSVDLVETIGVNHPNHNSARDTRMRSTNVCVDDGSWYRIDAAAAQRHHGHMPPVLHPGPRTDELSVDFDTHPGAHYFEQARCGMWVRMALIAALLNT